MYVDAIEIALTTRLELEPRRLGAVSVIPRQLVI